MSKEMAKAVFKRFPMMTEKRFWELVKIANWPNDGYNEPNERYLNELTPAEGMVFRRIVDSLWNVLDKFIGRDRNPAQGGDDSHSDLIYHVIGLGKKEFYASLADYSRLEKRGGADYESDDGYQESFGYCVPYVADWYEKEGVNTEELDEITKVIESLKEEKVLKAEAVIKKIADELLNHSDGHSISKIYNELFHTEQIEYKGDDTWKVKEKV